MKEKVYKHRGKTHILSRRFWGLDGKSSESTWWLRSAVACRYVSNERGSILTCVKYEVELARARGPHVIVDGGMK
jgi:hypothetical protein